MYIHSNSEDNDWNDVCLALQSHAARWQEIAQRLYVPVNEIAKIRINNHDDVSQCLYEAINYWINQNCNPEEHGMPSWRTLCKALSEVNGLNLAFRTLAKAHGGIVILIIITNVTIDSNAKSSLSAELIVDLINYQLGTEQYHRFSWLL